MNKNKLKNIALGVSLGLNILLGFFLGGGLISSCTAKKAENPVSSVSVDAGGELLRPTRKNALTPSYDEKDNLLRNATKEDGAYWNVGYLSYDPVRCAYYVPVKAGVYYFDCGHNRWNWAGFVRSSMIDKVAIVSIEHTRVQVQSSDVVNAKEYTAWNTTQYLYCPEDCYFLTTPNADAEGLGTLVLVAGLDTRPKYNVDLVDFNPLGWFSRYMSGDYILFTTNVTDATVQNTEFKRTFSTDLVFATLNDFRFFDALRVTARPLWDGALYVTDGGTHTYEFNDSDEFHLGIVDKVEFRDLSTGSWFTAGEARLVLQAGKPAYAGGLQWVNENYRKLSFYLLPEGATQPTTDEIYDYVTTTAWNTAPRYYGLNFLDWLSVKSNVVGGSVGGGDPFALLGNAFTSVAGILNIQILPFLTLGTLIFVPLVVLIILAILRLLAK